MKARTTLIFLFLFALSACGSPFAPVVVAPASVPTIALPAELPTSLMDRAIIWYGGVLRLKDPTGVIEVPFPADTAYSRLSSDDRLLTYVFHPLIIGEELPKPGDHEIRILDLQTGEQRTLVSKGRSFPEAVLFAAPTFTPDGKSVIYVVGWEHATDLAKVDVGGEKTRRLNVNVLLSGFAHPDISRDGQIVVVCAGPSVVQDLASELCLLNSEGKFIRYLTAEGYQAPGYGLFTPNGQYVVYESRYKLYKVRVDGGDRQQIAPCGMLGPLLVTDDYVVTACYVSQEPDCYGLFIASLDGKDFRRIGYVDPYCAKGK